MITYVTGDATAPQGEGTKLITHVCNDIGAWGSGFVVALSRRWKAPESAYRKMARRKLGDTQFVQVEDDIFVCNIIGQRDIRTRNRIPPVRYTAIRRGLEAAAEWCAARGASVHMPKMGAGLAGGDWKEVAQIVEETLCSRGIPVTVYTLRR